MHDLMSALALVEAGHINPVIDTVLPLDKIHEGHHILEADEHFGKVVIELP
jgi:NADPH:quinone reductase-like Zn-dependent oxidoreductase